MATPFACSFNRLLSSFFITHCHCILPPSLLSFCPSVSLSLYVVPHPVFLVYFPCGWEMLMFSSCNSKFFAVRHIHYPMNSSSDQLHTDAIVPSIDHFRTETVLPPSDHYCIDTVVPSSDHCCIVTVPQSSDHYGTTIYIYTSRVTRLRPG